MRPWLLRAALAVLAVALGVAAGAGPLQRSNSERDKELAAQKTQLERTQRQVAALRSGAAFADAYAKATAPAVLGGKLAGRSVVVITLAGADEATTQQLRSDVQAAGGQVTAQVALDRGLTRSTSRSLVEALTSQMLTQTPDVAVPTGASGYERFGALLARALGTGANGQPARAGFDATATQIMSGLKSSGLVSPTEPPGARAGLALVVAGPEADTDAEAAQNAVPVSILGAFGRDLPTVVVGPTGAAGDRGILAALRASSAKDAVSTVDSAETAMGEVAGVLALAARAAGTVGQYGAGDAPDGVLPGAKQ
jgi:hypothetical protein